MSEPTPRTTEPAAWLIWCVRDNGWLRRAEDGCIARGVSGQVGGAGRWTRSEINTLMDRAIAGYDVVPDPYGPFAEQEFHA